MTSSAHAVLMRVTSLAADGWSLTWQREIFVIMDDPCVTTLSWLVIFPTNIKAAAAASRLHSFSSPSVDPFHFWWRHCGGVGHFPRTTWSFRCRDVGHDVSWRRSHALQLDWQTSSQTSSQTIQRWHTEILHWITVRKFTSEFFKIHSRII